MSGYVAKVQQVTKKPVFTAMSLEGFVWLGLTGSLIENEHT